MAVLLTEEALLYAVRDVIRAAALITNSSSNVNIEHEEMSPNLVGHSYIAVQLGDVSPGPSHNTSGGVVDHLLSIDVSIIVRSQDMPKDRIRDKYLNTAKSLAKLSSSVNGLVDFSYSVLTAANTYLSTYESGVQNSQGFIEPLKFAGMSKPRAVGPQFFMGSGEGMSGLIRKISYVKARRVVSR